MIYHGQRRGYLLGIMKERRRKRKAENFFLHMISNIIRQNSRQNSRPVKEQTGRIPASGGIL